ncbi:alpha/beta hydrolase [Bacillaceae bacterium IKA-2]|nr:alpha/beta hydrolase [Bacillaceae bacterium IKA-2]
MKVKSKAIIKKIVAYTLAFLLLFSGYVILSVYYWSITDEGRLPPKTAVILHAVNNNIITSDMKTPKFLVKSSPSKIAREEITMPLSEDISIFGRVYYPKSEGPHPIILYYHGGAFLEGYGSIETHDNIIRALSARTGSVVIAVGYRVAPEYIFPTAVEDSYATLIWAYEQAERWNGDKDRIAVVGDSAGGNLATAVAIMARDERGPSIVAQALLYPLTTFQDLPLRSRIMYDSGYYLLSRNVMSRSRELYTPLEEMWLSPYLSPLNAENLADLPAALIITAEFDPLRDEGEQYGQRLAESGVPVRHLHYKGVMHGFISFYEVMELGEHGLAETALFLRQAFQEPEVNPEQYEQKIIGTNQGAKKIREYIEAYAMAAFIIVKDISAR